MDDSAVPTGKQIEDLPRLAQVAWGFTVHTLVGFLCFAVISGAVFTTQFVAESMILYVDSLLFTYVLRGVVILMWVFDISLFVTFLARTWYRTFLGLFR